MSLLDVGFAERKTGTNGASQPMDGVGTPLSCSFYCFNNFARLTDIEFVKVDVWDSEPLEADRQR
jgi:hypothetical protein